MYQKRMKLKSSLLVLTAIVVSGAGAQTVGANTLALGVKTSANVNIGVQASSSNKSANMQASTSASAGVRGNATSSAMKNTNSSSSTSTSASATGTAMRNTRASTTAGVHGSLTAQSHRSAVATFVQKLLSVADRDGGIGAQVRVIAQSQNDSASTTAAAIAKVQNRGSFHVFLTGSDYKNLGVIRSELATTSANIARLKTLLSQTTDVAVRAELSAEMQALEKEQAKVNAYIKANESRFSLFGWFNRMFVK